MEEFEKYSNSEILKMIDNLSKNHENVKKEILLLHEIMVGIEKEYLVLMEELKKRK